MKKDNQLLPWQVITVFCIALLFSACHKDGNDGKKTKTYTIYSPIYKEKSVVLAGLNGNASQSIEHAGKIYIKDNFIYLNEVNKGIHIIDNSNRARPVQIAFLSIPGNLDIAIKDNILYADMFSDLLAIDISDPHHAVLTSTLNDFFSGRNYVNGSVTSMNDQIVVDWNEKDTTIFIEDVPYPNNCEFCDIGFASVTSVKSSGTAGSMAGMVLMDDHLFAIRESHSVGIVDIRNAAEPVLKSDFFAGYDLQTIFPFEGKLFLGSAVGMFMYDVTDPVRPVSLGEFTHGRACDPVITDGNYAYVTLHAGDGCGGEANELHVIDVRDLLHSQLVKTYQLTKPTGLSKDGDILFICDHTEVKIYNAANPGALQLLKKITSNEPYDIIAGNGHAMVVCNNGLYQYDYSNINNIRLLSFLAAKK